MIQCSESSSTVVVKKCKALVSTGSSVTRADRNPCKIWFLYSPETKSERQYCIVVKSGTKAWSQILLSSVFLSVDKKTET